MRGNSNNYADWAGKLRKNSHPAIGNRLERSVTGKGTSGGPPMKTTEQEEIRERTGLRRETAEWILITLSTPEENEEVLGMDAVEGRRWTK